MSDLVPASGATPAALNDVHGDPWHWLVQYADGMQLREYRDSDGTPRAFAEARQHEAEHGRITHVVMVPQLDGLAPYVVLVPDGARPIIFRRRAVVALLNPDAPIPDLPPRVTALGWQRTIGRRNHQSIMCLYDDGSAVLTSDRNALG